MFSVLGPMLAVCDRLRTGMRLAVLVVVLVVPGAVTTAMYTVVRTGQLTFSATEEAGADTVRPILQALADITGGQTPDLAAVRDAAHAEPALGLTELADSLPPPGDSPAQRLALGRALTAMITEAGNTSNLILDPDLDSFYVMDAQLVQLPKALVAGLEAATPATDPTTDPTTDARLAVLAGTLAAAAESLRGDVKTADGSSRQAGLATRLAATITVADAASALAGRLSATSSNGPLPQPTDLGKAAQESIGPLHDVLAELLETRIGGFTGERRLVLGIAFGGFLLAGWFALAVLRRTVHDVRQTVRAVTAIADGDHTELPLPDGRDEWGDIGRALTVARTHLHRQEDEIRSGQAARSQLLRTSFQHQRQTEAEFKRRTQTVIDESTGVIAKELTEITDHVQHVRDASEVIDRSITTTDAATAAVVAQARESERVIRSLEQSLHRVASTASIVTAIAGQTRLLALNASIEAVRAGELGAGFTVVADEVKELATNTAKSTEQITATINDLERDTAAMAQTMTTMIEGIASVSHATDALRAVATDQDHLVNELSRRMTQTLSRVDDMSDLADRLERRQHDRVAAAATATLRVPGNQPVDVVTINVSAGGLRCTVPAALRLGEGDTVAVDLQRPGEEIALSAVVVNVVTLEDDTQPEVEIGLQFMVPDQATTDRLAEFVKRMIDGAAA